MWAAVQSDHSLMRGLCSTPMNMSYMTLPLHLQSSYHTAMPQSHQQMNTAGEQSIKHSSSSSKQ